MVVTQGQLAGGRRVGAPSEKTIRPNFFFALQVSQSKAVVAAIKSVHSSLLQHSAGLQAALVEPETAHLTILVTAQQAQDDVLFLDVKQDAQHERLMSFIQAARQHLQTAGVNSSDDRDFVAHVTIAKTSKVKGHQRKRGSPKKIAEEAYAEHIGSQAGNVLVTELQLCPMQGQQPGSYYNIQKSVKICPA
ncbi:hypothetical protein WJX82_009602 [Trebouxia sp. C0006]